MYIDKICTLVQFVWSNFCCNRNYNRNFQLCLFLIFASSFINRYPLYSVLLRKSNILQLKMLNYHLGQAQKIIKTSKINITENFCYNFCYYRNSTRGIGLKHHFVSFISDISHTKPVYITITLPSTLKHLCSL